MPGRIFAALLLLLAGLGAAHASPPVALGHSVVLLTGPWRFHTGDDPAWKDPSFDDSKWESVDLTPKPGAHDDDVGLTNYVPGWSVRGHEGYKGFAWYRLDVSVTVPQGESLSLVGPADVDSIYEIYLNGRLIGSDGDFSHSPPTVVSVQPHLFAVPRADWVVSGERWSGVISIRVWCRVAAPPDGGGIHIAPFLGTDEGANAQYRMQWNERFNGNIVDAMEGVVFALLAVMALTMMPFDRRNGFYPFLVASLLLLGAAWANQAVYFWGQFETATDYIVLRYILLNPLLLGFFTMTWHACFGLSDTRRMALATTGLTLLCMAAQIASASLLAGVVPHSVAVAASYVLSCGRLGFLALLLLIVCRAVMSGLRGQWLAPLALLCVSVSLFSPEISELGVPGIWFPLGIGVSRTEYANAAFAVVLFALLLQRLWGYAPARSGPAHD